MRGGRPVCVRRTLSGRVRDAGPRKGSIMKHVLLLSRRPSHAQSDLCTGFQSDYQVLLCFLLEIIQTVFPAFSDSKTPTQS